MFPGVAHVCWTRTYDLRRMGTASTLYEPFDNSVFEWMLLYKRN